MYLKFLKTEDMLRLYQELLIVRGKSSELREAIGRCSGGYCAIVAPTEHLQDVFDKCFPLYRFDIRDGTYVGEFYLQFDDELKPEVVCMWDNEYITCKEFKDKDEGYGCFVILVKESLANKIDLVNLFIQNGEEVRVYD